MAGLSNSRFLTPSHFTTFEAGHSEKPSKKNTKSVLIPPSEYEKVEQSKSIKNSGENLMKKIASLERENSEQRQTIEKLLEEKRLMNLVEEKKIVKKGKREESLESELILAKRKISDLEQEKEMFQYELQDKEALSGIVLKLKKEVKKAKEKLSVKEKVMAEKMQEYSEMAKRLKSELKAAESARLEQITRFRENNTKQFEDTKKLEEKNSELRKLFELKQLEFEHVLNKAEQEKNEIAKNYKKNLAELDISKNSLEKLGESNQLLDKENKKMKEINRKVEDDTQRMKEDIKRIEDEKNMITEDRKRIEKEEERVESELANEKKKCLHLENDVSSKDSRITELQHHLELQQNELKLINTGYINEIATKETDYKLKVGKLEELLQSKDHEHQKEHQAYEETLQQKVNEIKELTRSMEQLRSYIGEVRPSQEAQSLKQANEQLSSTINVLTEENNTLHSTVKLLNVRLSSILEIVSIQENELTRKYENVVENPKDCQGLLRRWREKVFALMVQLRSQKIVEDNQRKEEEVKLSMLNAKIEDLEREQTILSHKLADKEAALELETNLKTTKTQELQKLKEDASALQNQQKQWLAQFENLRNTAHAVEKTLLQLLSSFKKTVNKVLSFDERIKFAGCRIHFITGYLMHHESKIKASENGKTECKDDSGDENDLLGNGEQHLKEEVERLLKERALLLNETKRHNDVLQEKISLITEEFESMIEQKDEKIKKLEVSVAEMEQKLDMLKDNLETKSGELDEAQESIEELKLTLSKQKTTMEKVHREAFEKERLRNVEDMTNLEGQLNDVRREHTKAVMALKNSERQVSWEKENCSKMISNIEREFNEKLTKCQKQLRSVEKERNILMTSIREDKKNVSRPCPMKGGENTDLNTDYPMKEKTTVKKSKIHVGQLSSVRAGAKTSGDTEGNLDQEDVKLMDPDEALMALKELKMLSEQIVKMQGEKDISDSEH